jgi:hypothetical protein
MHHLYEFIPRLIVQNFIFGLNNIFQDNCLYLDGRWRLGHEKLGTVSSLKWHIAVSQWIHWSLVLNQANVCKMYRRCTDPIEIV